MPTPSIPRVRAPGTYMGPRASRHFGEDKKPLASAGNQTAVHPACSLVTIVTQLCWLLSFPVPFATAVRILDTYKATHSLTQKSNKTEALSSLTRGACGGISFLSD